MLERVQKKFKKVHKNDVFGVLGIPLTGVVKFEAQVQKCNLFQVPKKVRWAFKMESDQMLKVEIIAPTIAFGQHTFLAKMGKDGRIRIPKLVCAILNNEEPNLGGAIVDVTLHPADVSNQ